MLPTKSDPPTDETRRRGPAAGRRTVVPDPVEWPAAPRAVTQGSDVNAGEADGTHELLAMLRRGDVERVLAITARALSDGRDGDEAAGLLTLNALASRLAGRPAEAAAAWRKAASMHRQPELLARMLTQRRFRA